MQAYALVKAENQQEDQKQSRQDISPTIKSDFNQYAVGKTVEVWDSDEADWYQANIEKIEADQFFIHYIGYGSSYDEWVGEDEIRTRALDSSNNNGYAVSQKVKVWDEDDEDWYSATIEKIQGKQYFVHYIGYDSSSDEWVNQDEIR